MTKTITVIQLLVVHNIICSTQKKKIAQYLTRIDENQNIELSQNEIDEMFESADNVQKQTLESIFGKQKPSIDYNKIKTGSKVMLKMTTKHCRGTIDPNIPANVIFYKTPHYILTDNCFYKSGYHSSYCTFEQKGKFIVFSSEEYIDFITEVIEY